MQPENTPTSPDSFIKYFDNQFDERSRVEMTTVNPARIVDYVKSMAVVYEAVTRDRPDMVFFPDRRAGPLMWTIEAFEEQDRYYGREKITIPKATLPIGTLTEIVSNKNSGLGSNEKKTVIAEEIRRLKESGQLPERSFRIVLVDEAQSGATSAQAIRLLTELFASENPQFTYIACKDERFDTKIRPAAESFKTLVSGETAGIEGFAIPIPMFYIDKSPLLDTIVSPFTKDSNAVKNPSDRLKMFIKIHNVGARQSFMNISRMVFYPELTDVALNPEEASRYVGTKLEKIAKEVADWCSEIYSYYPVDSSQTPEVISQNMNMRKQKIAWFRKLRDICKSSKYSTNNVSQNI
ncbi:MAG: hypothetical protein WCO33_01465 [bacterium]